MKISGQPQADTLDVTGGGPKTSYLVRFQDLGSGRTSVSECATDDGGDARINAPMAWGIGAWKGSAQVVGTDSIIEFVNSNDEDGSFTMQDAASVEKAPSTEEPPKYQGGAKQVAPASETPGL